MQNESISMKPNKAPKVKPPKPQGPPKPRDNDKDPFIGKEIWAIRTAQQRVKVIDPEELYRRIMESVTDAYGDYVDELDEVVTNAEVMAKKTLCIEPDQDLNDSQRSQLPVKNAAYYRKRIVARARTMNAKNRGDRD
jgi:hypothetical protein